MKLIANPNALDFDDTFNEKGVKIIDGGLFALSGATLSTGCTYD